jgi:hypothetical protein
LFLTCQHLNAGTNLRECEDQSWFKVQAVPVFRFHVFAYPLRYLLVRPGVCVPQAVDLFARGLLSDGKVRGGMGGIMKQTAVT